VAASLIELGAALAWATVAADDDDDADGSDDDNGDDDEDEGDGTVLAAVAFGFKALNAFTSWLGNKISVLIRVC